MGEQEMVLPRVGRATMKPTSRSTPDPVALPDQITVMTQGHPDDHLRMVVAVATLVEPDSDEARACIEPKTTWPKRLEAFRLLVAHHRPRLAVFDPDALDVVPTDEERWSDATMAGQRSSFLLQLLELGREHSWTLLRPRPSTRLSEKVDAAGYRRESATPQVSVDFHETLILNELVPEVREIAAAMLRDGALELGTLRRLIHQAGDEDEAATTIAAMAYDTLGPQVRRAARTLSALREPVSVNGTVGPFPWLIPSDPKSSLGVSRPAVDQLRRLSMLRPVSLGGSGSQVRMPRSARKLLEAQLGSLGDAQAIHRYLAELPASTPVQKADRHHHAVYAGDLTKVFADAPYASDARLLAYRLSHKRNFAEAADVYRHIIQQFDEEDAYAWEYLAWNLARHHGNAAFHGELAKEIADAYGRAHELEPDNPLYHGRWLAFRARRGDQIVTEFLAGLADYTAAGHSYPGAVTWYAEPVLKVLQKSRRHDDDLSLVRARAGGFLLAYDRLRDLLG